MGGVNHPPETIRGSRRTRRIAGAANARPARRVLGAELTTRKITGRLDGGRGFPAGSKQQHATRVAE
ncbi:hypothetical protein CBR14_22915, partial [Cronobacter sakazakii]